MKYRGFNPKRDLNEVRIVEILETFGCTVQRLNQPFDLLVNRKGELHLVEVKQVKGKLNKKQEAARIKWPVTIIRTVEDAMTFARGE